MRWFPFRRMTSGLVLSVLAAVSLVGINEASFRESAQALAEIEEAQQMKGALNQLLQSVLDAETGQRGYLLTGEPRYREPYDRAIVEVNRHLATLRQLYASRPTERERLTVLAGHVARKLGELDLTVRLRQSEQEDSWKFVTGTDVGREEMENIRVQTSTLVTMSNRTLEAGHAQITKDLNFARLAITLVALAALAAFVLYLRQTHELRLIGERQQEALQRERNRLEAQVRERTVRLAELATHLQEVRETERGHLARELHDELGSLLTAAKLEAARLKSRLADSPEAALRLQHLTELLNSGIALKRRIIEDLRPSSLSNLGLVTSLEILGREFADRSGMQIEMLLEPVTLDESRQLTIYRMVQESLTNIGKYAQASEATIVLKDYGNHVVVEISDNGKGFDTERVRPSSHGLAGMRHRVEAAGGKLTITSTLGQGTRLSAIVPTAALAPTPTPAQAQAQGAPAC